MEDSPPNHCKGVTFVTCYVNIYENEPFQHKNAEWRIKHFEQIASTGVHICLYGDEITTPYLLETIQKYPNIKWMTMDTPYKETEIYKACLTPDVTFPERRNANKDNIEYMGLMNAKIEFMYDAVHKNPFDSGVFAWMDFSMAYLFNKEIESCQDLKTISESTFIDTFMAVPGCWEPIPPNNCSAIINNIHWRFCGTFFIGDKESILTFHRLYREHFPKFIEEQKKIVWEVNIWAWLEANTDWKPNWYISDHNDRLIHLPETIFVVEPTHFMVMGGFMEPNAP